MKLIIKIFLLFTLLLSAVSSCNAQTFECTKVTSNNLSTEKLNSLKKEILSAKIVIKLYEDDMKVTAYNSKGEIHETFVLTRMNDDEYMIEEKSSGGKASLKFRLHKTAGFIHSIDAFREEYDYVGKRSGFGITLNEFLTGYKLTKDITYHLERKIF